MAHRFRDPAPSTPNSPAELGGHDHYHRFLRRLFGPQVRSASRSQGHLDRTTASAGLCCRANSLRSNQPNLCGMMWGKAAVIEGIRSAANAEARKAGALRAFADNPAVTVVAQETANWKIDEAYEVAKGLFTREPGISLLFCANDMMALGASRYIQEA